MLCSHPHLEAGQRRGISAKYYGPFKVVGINPNGCNYVIKNTNKVNARPKQLHKNNLKAYFYRAADQPMPCSQDNPIVAKRKYTKRNKEPTITNPLPSSDTNTPEEIIINNKSTTQSDNISEVNFVKPKKLVKKRTIKQKIKKTNRGEVMPIPRVTRAGRTSVLPIRL